MQTLQKSIKWKNRNLPPQPPKSFHPKVNHCLMLLYPTRKKCMCIYSFIYPNELHYAHFRYRHLLLYISWYYFHNSTWWWPHSFCSYKQCCSEYLCTHSEHLCTPILVLHAFCYSAARTSYSKQSNPAVWREKNNLVFLEKRTVFSLEDSEYFHLFTSEYKAPVSALRSTQCATPSPLTGGH